MWRNEQKESTERETLEEHMTITETRRLGQEEIKPSLQNDQREKRWQVKEQQLTVRANLYFQALNDHPPDDKSTDALLRQEKYFV